MNVITEIRSLEDLIANTIKGKVIEQNVTTLLPPGENYASDLYKVELKVKVDDEEREFHAVAKCFPRNPAVQELSNTNLTFKLEVAWYTVVIPTLTQFQKDRGLTETLDFFQKVYGARISLDPSSNEVDENAVIITENLKYSGYTNIDRTIGFNLVQAQAILEKLAEFHAVPLAIKHHDPDLFNTNIRPHLDVWTSEKDLEAEFLKSIFDVYQHIPECQSLMERITNTVTNSIVFRQRAVREPWATAVHMDLWSNIMITTDSKNPKIIILDFQCPAYASPLADLALFLLTSVEHEVILNNFDNLTDFYYKSFIKNLKKLSVPIEQFSKEAFLDELNTEAKIGELAHALVHIAITFTEKTTSSTANSGYTTGDDVKKAIDEIYEVRVNEKHIKKFKWITTEAEKRKWI